MNTMTSLAVRAGTLLTVAIASAGAQQGPFVRPRADRLSDEIIAADLSRLDSLQVAYHAQSRERSAMLVGLAREAYERNDDGVLTEQLIADARDGSHTVPRTRRPDYWATIDSSVASPSLFVNPGDAVPKERELLRAQFPILGAPNCDAHEAEAGKYVLRLRPPPTPPQPKVEPAPEPVRPVAKPEPEPVLPSLVHFALDKYYLSVTSKLVLDTVVQGLADFPDVKIDVEGHTDQRANVRYNITLSQNRANAVRSYLIAKGIDPSRISTHPNGKGKLDNDVPAVSNWAKNRRVELKYSRQSGKAVRVTVQYDDLQLETRRKK